MKLFIHLHLAQRRERRIRSDQQPSSSCKYYQFNKNENKNKRINTLHFGFSPHDSYNSTRKMSQSILHHLLLQKANRSIREKEKATNTIV